MAKGIFPRMDPSEIINALTGWGFPVNQAQLHNPTSEFVESVYFACLQQVTELNQETLREPVQSTLDASQTEERDLYTNALATNMMLYHITRLAKAARIDDFNAKDLYAPERDRTHVILSAFINFVKFTEQYCENFVKDLRERSASLIHERDQLLDEVEGVRRAIEDKQEQINEDEPRRVTLLDENKELRAKLFATKDFQVAAVKEVEDLKTEKSAINKRREAYANEIEALEENISRAKSRIVQSPDRLKRTISSLRHTLLDDRKSMASNEAKQRELQAKINVLLALEKDIRACTEQLDMLEREAHALQQSQKQLAEVKDHFEAKSIERNELRMRQDRVQKQLLNAQEKLERTQRHAEEKKVASQRTIERLQREYDEMSLERRDNDKQVEELRAEAENVEKKMGEHLKASELELNELLAEYWRLRHEADLFIETLATKLDIRMVPNQR